MFDGSHQQTGGNVLIVDDQASNRELLEELLSGPWVHGHSGSRWRLRGCGTRENSGRPGASGRDDAQQEWVPGMPDHQGQPRYISGTSDLDHSCPTNRIAWKESRFTSKTQATHRRTGACRIPYASKQFSSVYRTTQKIVDSYLIFLPTFPPCNPPTST
jgi:hypothetical protein